VWCDTDNVMCDVTVSYIIVSSGIITLGCVPLEGWIWERVWRWICVDLGGWIFVFFWVDLEGKMNGFGDKFYEN